MKGRKESRITLVGAGPGCEDLITVRGLRALRSADVVLYDALVGKKLLEEVSESAQSIYVGKRCGKHSYGQDDINRLLVECAMNYGHVVRLKGGDPFVFGRATEEITYAESFGIPVTVVPGVTSAISVPASQGIPVTARGVSSSFWVMTATKRDGTFSEDLMFAARSQATMVILMGMRKLDAIVGEVLKYRGPATPMALIQNGTLPNESCVLTTLGKVPDCVNRIDTGLPGIIVIGDVVAEHPSFFQEEVQRVLYSNL
ncbi:uroporphyrinogen-III C-methyltransferase [Pseudozobellia thermophila]|uniref:uroporphyrinogen-III C-methyltransferase n=1 Tax=Pseudozobellia thermophila TaxID=192903 RepID=A0A1M6FRP9_9FLAO|nr:uroporphyrinogen-III C-methyltransferase [Pseudozobellia thermophila]SHJ00381.1 uroporphyrin-III C-methyltransferase [Pseudozobellia thermophila]